MNLAKPYNPANPVHNAYHPVAIALRESRAGETLKSEQDQGTDIGWVVFLAVVVFFCILGYTASDKEEDSSNA